MIPDNVTLIVKAPNQQIDDQNIECQSSWTVKDLKSYLSEVYPSKPSTDEQKIIYSGQLLEDKTILKDVLRVYDSQLGHTMHLVCTPKRRAPEPKPQPPPKESQNLPDGDGLRQRNVPEATEQPRPETRQNDQNHTVEMQNYLASFMNNYGRVPPYVHDGNLRQYLPVTNTPATMANHMLMMQQAYMQYMQQYANMWQAAGAAPVPEGQPVNVVNQVPPQRLGQPRAGARAGGGAGAEEEARDWLDHVYSASRLAVLFSLLYLYSTPFRLLLVIMLAAVGYLHQVGFFRDLGLPPPNDNRQNNAAPQNVPPNNVVPNVQNNVEPNVQNNVEPNVQNIVEPNVQNNIEPNNVQNNVAPNNVNVSAPEPVVNNENDNQSLLAVGWMVFSTFFASLIPEMNQ